MVGGPGFPPSGTGLIIPVLQTMRLQIANSAFGRRITTGAVWLCLTLSLTVGFSAHGQTVSPPVSSNTATTMSATRTSDAGYSGAVLSDFTDKIRLNNRFYVIEDPDFSISRAHVETIIRSRKLDLYLSKSEKYNMGISGKSAWLVFPISSISNYNNWKLSFGAQFEGRYSPLKEFSLYDMNSGKYLYQTDTLNNPSQVVPETFRIEAHPQNTTFLLVYVRSAPAVLTILSPEIINPRKETPLWTWKQWIMSALSFSGFLSALALFKVTRNSSHIFLSLVWLLCFIRHVFVSNFLYVDFIASDLFIPLTWAPIPLLILSGLWTSPGTRDEIPFSFIIGAACLFLISSVTGLILIQPMPTLATSLIYGPSGVACLIAVLSTWPYIFAGRRMELTGLAASSLFFGLMIAWVCLISTEIVPAVDETLTAGEVLLILAILSSILFSSSKREAGTSLRHLIVKNDFYDEDQGEADASHLKEAKELSEHKRLIHVLEKERKNMTEMQLQSARQTEEMRKSKEMADEANRAKSAFLAIVSHEIRTPMTGIMGMIRLLQDTQITKEQREYIYTIKDSGEAMLALLNDILDYEKIESGKMELEALDCDIKRLARSIHTLMSGHAASKNIDLILELDPSIPHWVKCDPTRLRQVILNLLNNAIKFTSKGAVYLRIRNLTSDELSSQGMHQLYFAVQDSGIGISPEVQKKLFMPFAQADSSINRKYGGTGLGLAICKRLIETMGGGISINSKESEGSTFFFTLNLPAGTAQNDQQPAPQEQSSEQAVSFSKDLNILIVDDNGINQKVVAGFVSKQGAGFETASNGQDALNQIAQNHFDMILMDIELPDMNGMEVTQRIRHLNLPHKAATPIVALTGNIADDDLQAYRHAGMNDFAPKPITFEKITELLLKADHQIAFPWNEDALAARAPSSPPSAEQARQDEIQDSDRGEENLTISTNEFELFPVAEAVDTTDPNNPENPFLIETNTDFLTLDDLTLSEEDEDSFALAVRKFEEMQNNTQRPASDAENPEALSAYGLDEAIMNSLISGLPFDAMHEILSSFYEKANELIAAIGTAFLNGNAAEMSARAHELKGMAGNFGFAEISQMSSRIEASSKSGQIGDAKDDVEHLGERYAVSRNRLIQWLEEKR